MLFTKDYSKLLLIPEGKEGAASLPDQSTLVSATAFSRCSVLSQILVGDSATFSSYDGMLYSKDMKTLVACPAGIGASIMIPAETETIDKDALAGCKDLASITALGNVQKIDPTAFSDETKATAVVALPAGQDYDSRKATWENTGFKNFAEPAKPGATTNPDTTNEATGLTYTLLDDYTLSVSWQGKDDPQANLEIPASAEINGVPYRVSTIANNAFANRGSLASVKLPTTITTINTAAFAGCANLATIEFPNTLCTIGERAFEATSLKDVWLPASIETIGSRTFASCSNLDRVVALRTPEVASDAIAGCTNVSIYAPSDSEDSWNPGLPSDNNHLMPYGISLSEEPLTVEAGQEANLLEGGNLQAPDPIEASYSYAAAPLSVDAGQVSAKKEGTSEVATILSLDGVELIRASRAVEVSPNSEGREDTIILNSEVALPSAYLAEVRDNQINVDAPFAVTFGQDTPYDVAHPNSSIEAPVSFTNNMQFPLQLAKLECAIGGVTNYLTPIENDFSLDKQKLFSFYPKGAQGEAVSFGYGVGINTLTRDDLGAFVVAPNSSSTYTFRLNLTNDPSLAKAKVNSSIANDGATTYPLASVTYTFERSNFFLQDKSTGRTYGLSKVKEHANDIAKNKNDSPYWNQYQGYLADDSSYTCRVKWDDDYDVRIIDINHDELATTSIDGPTVAGLTFQFKNLLPVSFGMNTPSTIGSGGWGQSELRARMNPDNLSNKEGTVNGDDDNYIWNKFPSDIQSQMATVKKFYNWDYNSTSSSTVLYTEDKLFLPSFYELTGSTPTDYHPSWTAAEPWLGKEGTQYKYYDGQVNAVGQNIILQKGDRWWIRTLNPQYGGLFLYASEGGDVMGYMYSSDAVGGICPCFCL